MYVLTRSNLLISFIMSIIMNHPVAINEVFNRKNVISQYCFYCTSDNYTFSIYFDRQVSIHSGIQHSTVHLPRGSEICIRSDYGN